VREERSLCPKTERVEVIEPPVIRRRADRDIFAGEVVHGKALRSSSSIPEGPLCVAPEKPSSRLQRSFGFPPEGTRRGQLTAVLRLTQGEKLAADVSLADGTCRLSVALGAGASLSANSRASSRPPEGFDPRLWAVAARPPGSWRPRGRRLEAPWVPSEIARSRDR
jgi:hypothetical protein